MLDHECSASALTYRPQPKTFAGFCHRIKSSRDFDVEAEALALLVDDCGPYSVRTFQRFSEYTWKNHHKIADVKFQSA